MNAWNMMCSDGPLPLLVPQQMMAPDDEFVAYVQSGEPVGSLADDDICSLTSTRC